MQIFSKSKISDRFQENAHKPESETIMDEKTEEKKKDLRIRRTKEAIRETFKEMVCEMPYEKITVKEIAGRAKINRNTFYLHYETIDDVLKEIQSDYSERYMKIISGYNLIHDQKEIVRTFFEFMEAQDDFFKKITCDSRFDYIREKMQRKVMANTEPKTEKIQRTERESGSGTIGKDEAVKNIVRAFSSTSLNLYRQWTEDGKKIPLQEAIELSATLLENGMKGFSEKRR